MSYQAEKRLKGGGLAGETGVELEPWLCSAILLFITTKTRQDTFLLAAFLKFQPSVHYLTGLCDALKTLFRF